MHVPCPTLETVLSQFTDASFIKWVKWAFAQTAVM
jgi:hypothetical protein